MCTLSLDAEEVENVDVLVNTLSDVEALQSQDDMIFTFINFYWPLIFFMLKYPSFYFSK